MLNHLIDDEFLIEPDLPGVDKAIKYTTALIHRDLAFDETSMLHHIRYVLQQYKERLEG